MTNICEECGKEIEGKVWLGKYCKKCYTDYLKRIGKFNRKKYKRYSNISGD